MPKRLSREVKETIWRLAGTGLTDAVIAEKCGCARQTVSRVRAAGSAPDRTTKGRILQVRISRKEAEAFEEVLLAQGMTASEALRRMIRTAEGVVDFRAEEVAALHQSGNQLNAMARNLVQLLHLARAGKLKWNARDGKLVAELADRTEEVARATQALKAAAMRGAFVRSADIARGLGDG